jgi:hypothetical protein
MRFAGAVCLSAVGRGGRDGVLVVELELVGYLVMVKSTNTEVDAEDEEHHNSYTTTRCKNERSIVELS